MNEQNIIKKELIEKLKTISDDRDFLLSIVNTVKTIEERKTIIDYIDNGEDVTYENIILLALTIYQTKKQ